MNFLIRCSHSSLFLVPKSTENEKGNKIVQDFSANEGNNIFMLKSVKENLFQIVHCASELVLGPKEGSLENSTQIELQEPTNDDFQKWNIVHFQNNQYAIKNYANPKKGLDLYGGRKQPKTQCILYDLHYGSNQLFRFELPIVVQATADEEENFSIKNEDFYIFNTKSNKVLENVSGKLKQFSLKETDSQLWNLVKVKDCYAFQSKSTENFISFQQEKHVTCYVKATDIEKAEKFVISKLSMDFFTIKSRESTKIFDICGGSVNDNADVIMYQPHYSSNQLFYFRTKKQLEKSMELEDEKNEKK
ncbi:hypothetical protein M0813_16788 [Anaeramoeba flamelloides]|uniref:Ricin B lectin domain-containing protein n=1 Tax=Anaeramoeba flamelloides TaxID=1746091 RepID=A0ABQ8YYT3_9EUKA|nr:hypothetical protein M0813_16788 [Anaeramoeba flamelloides]